MAKKKQWPTATVSSKDADADAAKWNAQAGGLSYDSIGFAPESNPGPHPRDASVDSESESQASFKRFKAGTTSEPMKQSAPKPTSGKPAASKPSAKAKKPKKVAAKPDSESSEPF